MAAQKPPYYHYVPDEICVVVSLDPGAEPAAEEWGARVYDPVLDFLNERLAPVLGATAGAAGDDPLAPDFTPTLARQRYQQNPTSVRLQRLERGRVSPSARTGGPLPWDSAPPWVTLRRRDGGTTALHFYRIGPGQTTRDSWTPGGAQVVRELANVVNRGLWRQRIAAVPGAVVAATPNWLFPAASNGAGYTGGGPATDPQPVPPGTPPSDEPYRFQFDNPGLRDLVARQRAAALAADRDPRVVVAILDTCPKPDDVRARAESTGNWLLGEVARTVKIDDPQFVPPDYHAFVDGISPGHPRNLPAGVSNDIPDHGLFAAGIIRDIAPTAEIHLIRVLDDTGVGDLLLLTNVLAALPALPAFSGRKLAINLSLMAGLPVNADLPASWFPVAAGQPDTMLRSWSAMSATFEAIHTSLAAVISWLEEQGVLVVAAAGNDASQGAARPEPRYPARYDTVLGVAAINLEGRASAFSNQGDFIQIGNGVAVFGGDSSDFATQAVVGIFSQPEFPFVPPGTKNKNETGWAYWSGTSFATPVVTAIAADVWTEHPDLSPADLITIVTRSVGVSGTLPGDTPGVLGLFASAPEPDLVCTAIMARQAPR